MENYANDPETMTVGKKKALLDQHMKQCNQQRIKEVNEGKEET